MTFSVSRLRPTVWCLCVTSAVALPAYGAGTASASNPSESATSAFHGTAYLKTSNTVVYADKPYGLARSAAQGQIDVCNEARMRYGVQPVLPPESLLAGLDVFVNEKVFDTDKALTVVTGGLLTLPDLQRWVSELASSGSATLPAVPPDCQPKLLEVRHGTLWRDGLVYELRYDTHKALGRRATKPPTLAGSTAAFSNAPQAKYLGQSCREVIGGVDIPGEGHSCIWDLFPYVAYLNWPFALSGRVQFGPTAAMVETIVPISVAQGHAIPASVFDIPAGFTVVGP